MGVCGTLKHLAIITRGGSKETQRRSRSWLPCYQILGLHVQRFLVDQKTF